VIYFEPRLPERLDGLSFPLQFRDTPIRVTIDGSELNVEVLIEGLIPSVRVGVGDDVRELAAGDSCTFSIAARASVV
jgi:trehalose/maltose hydrolase-like predicted phosphorylase